MSEILRIVIDTNHIMSAILSVCSDESGNRFLECAVAGNADYLVTKNIRDFPAKEYQRVKIVRIAKFLNVLEQMENALKKLISP